ncbi:MAG: hypothetical protein F4103_12815 [Boseongicola sp. SB0673_bin_14]|nr:hypothetical protein [Boseongicola sp. SB0673_bin_14]
MTARSVVPRDRGAGRSVGVEVALFPEGREAPGPDCKMVKINVAEVSLHDHRERGASWLAPTLWGWLEMDRFRSPCLSPDRRGNTCSFR